MEIGELSREGNDRAGVTKQKNVNQRFSLNESQKLTEKFDEAD